MRRPRALHRGRCRPIPKSGWRCFRGGCWNWRSALLPPDAVHIATEGHAGAGGAGDLHQDTASIFDVVSHPLSRICESAVSVVPLELVYRWLRWFHGPATAMMVATESLKREMAAHGFHHLRIWSRGVDVEHFPSHRGREAALYGADLAYVGRVAVEKNIEAFWRWTCRAPSWWWGDGPAKTALAEKYPAAKFTGALNRRGPGQGLSASSVFVFPRPHRYFRPGAFGGHGLRHSGGGLSGAGAADVVGEAPVGALDEDLKAACLKALEIAKNPKSPTPREFALGHSWRACYPPVSCGISVVEPDLD